MKTSASQQDLICLPRAGSAGYRPLPSWEKVPKLSLPHPGGAQDQLGWTVEGAPAGGLEGDDL